MYQSVNGILIHYEIIGAGKPVVFLHGMCLDLISMKLNYEDSFSKKNGSYQRIYIDIPGMGKSQSFFKVQPSSDYLVELIIEFLNLIKVDNFYLCGHSYGGYLSLGLAYKYPKRVKGLFLTCPVVTANPNKRVTASHINIKNDNFNIPKNKYTEDFLEMNVIINEKSWKKYLNEITVGLEKYNAKFLEKLQSNNFEYYRFQKEQTIKNWNSDIPIFFLLGKHDQVVGFKEQKKLAANFKDYNLLILEEAGHNLPIDQSNLFSNCVNYFFKL